MFTRTIILQPNIAVWIYCLIAPTIFVSFTFQKYKEWMWSFTAYVKICLILWFLYMWCLLIPPQYKVYMGLQRKYRRECCKTCSREQKPRTHTRVPRYDILYLGFQTCNQHGRHTESHPLIWCRMLSHHTGSFLVEGHMSGNQEAELVSQYSRLLWLRLLVLLMYLKLMSQW